MKKIFLLLIVVIFYLSISELSAKRKAETFCDSVEIGQSSNNLLEKAIEAGARRSGTYWFTDHSQQNLYAAFTGYYAGSDFICGIETKNNVVMAKHPHLASSLF